MSGVQPSVLPLPGTPSSGPPGPAPPGAPPPGAPPGREPFHSALAEEWARTAPAEGHKTEGKQKNDGQPRRPRSPKEGGEPAAVALAAQAVRAGQAGRKLSASLSQESTAKPHAPAQESEPSARAQRPKPDSAVMPADATGEPTDREPGANAAPSAAGTDAPALPDEAAPPRVASGAAGDISRALTDVAAPKAKAAATAGGEHPAAPAGESAVAPALTPGPSSAHTGTRPRPPASAPPADKTGTTARAATEKAPSHASPQPATDPSVPSVSSPSGEAGGTGIAPVAQGSGVTGAGVVGQEGTGIRLQDMIDSIRSTIELSVRQGTTQARIALSPESLGDIRIHLTQSSAGLLARVTASTADAAKVLAQGRAELQQSLSGLGLSLLGLDIGLSGQGAWGDGRLQGGPHTKTAAVGKTDGEQDDEVEAIAPAEAGPSGPAKGDLVDVLA